MSLEVFDLMRLSLIPAEALIGSGDNGAWKFHNAPEEQHAACRRESPSVAAILAARKAGIDPRRVQKVVAVSAAVPSSCYGRGVETRDIYHPSVFTGNPDNKGSNIVGDAYNCPPAPSKPWTPEHTLRELEQRAGRRKRTLGRAVKLWLRNPDFTWDDVGQKLGISRAEVRQVVREARSLLGFRALRRSPEQPRGDHGRFVDAVVQPAKTKTTRKPL